MTHTAKPDLKNPAVYPHWCRETLRYCDTDQQGHINNVAFSVFCETGRTQFLLEPDRPLTPPGTFMVIARLVLDFIGEIHWPGEVRIGTGVTGIGRSSFHLGQGVFVGDRCVAIADSVLVLADQQTRRSTPLPDDLRARVEAMMITVPA
ncbi:thioesterase [Paramagnetospirillum caucaseum]|uniref:Thioesterase n=1 Tax=Paramagnetospirillum caucaseum TaxID=1244869 RepID=M3ACH6_9PROT|nr:thioesterase family protein [Paramagnetospirillum caucaseum]EME70219.1 thioesterase [Paramagnetospirillum caucaseum]